MITYVFIVVCRYKKQWLIFQAIKICLPQTCIWNISIPLFFLFLRIWIIFTFSFPHSISHKTKSLSIPHPAFNFILLIGIQWPSKPKNNKTNRCMPSCEFEQKPHFITTLKLRYIISRISSNLLMQRFICFVVNLMTYLFSILSEPNVILFWFAAILMSLHAAVASISFFQIIQ